MEPECKRITRVVLPAIRASIADAMGKKGYTQVEIAERLGIVQVAVSKYLNNKCSKDVINLKSYIESRKLNSEILSVIFNGAKKQEIDSKIGLLCEQISTL
jgi:predicted transcriptional regulator